MSHCLLFEKFTESLGGNRRLETNTRKVDPGNCLPVGDSSQILAGIKKAGNLFFSNDFNL